ncbi:DUF4385 domain-containing protein [Candidatus Pacebacteria bacterium]|nr:DUF4385 domain-containing protein [Candidatus Paceibacterota bacterium]
MSKPFDYNQAFDRINFRQEPERYQVGKGEQGVLSVEPYKSEILPHWRFKTPEVARQSAEHIYDMFKTYQQADDFVGMDMARKFLQMGYTRSRRYANHKSGRKYSTEDKLDQPVDIPPTPPYKTAANREHHVKSRTKKVLPLDPDPEKAESAEIFYDFYTRANTDESYRALRAAHKELYG